MSKGYIIAHLNIQKKAAFGMGYALKVERIISEFGGKFLVRGNNVPYAEGDKFDIDVIAEFPDLALAQACLASNSYKEIDPHRKDNTTGQFMVVEGV
jgi:uncharacterized protein (DUF1330 family)